MKFLHAGLRTVFSPKEQYFPKEILAKSPRITQPGRMTHYGETEKTFPALCMLLEPQRTEAFENLFPWTLEFELPVALVRRYCSGSKYSTSDMGGLPLRKTWIFPGTKVSPKKIHTPRWHVSGASTQCAKRLVQSEWILLGSANRRVQTGIRPTLSSLCQSPSTRASLCVQIWNGHFWFLTSYCRGDHF